MLHALCDNALGGGESPAFFEQSATTMLPMNMTNIHCAVFEDAVPSRSRTRTFKKDADWKASSCVNRMNAKTKAI